MQMLLPIVTSPLGCVPSGQHRSMRAVFAATILMGKSTGCDDNTGAVSIANCFCMTTGELEDNNSPMVGACLYTCTRFKLNHYRTDGISNNTCGPYTENEIYTNLPVNQALHAYAVSAPAVVHGV